jgi:hypothetical protein
MSRQRLDRHMVQKCEVGEGGEGENRGGKMGAEEGGAS